MESVHGLPSEQSQLLGVVRGVRNRYRAKRALRGGAITVAASWAVLVAAAYAMSVLKYTDAAVLWCRIAAIGAIAAIVIRFLVWPLLPILGDNHVALYLEEHEKNLRATVITAVEMQHPPHADASRNGLRSPAIVERLTRNALERVRRAGDGLAIDAGELRTNTAILASVTAAAMLFTVLGPQVLRHGLQLIAMPWSNSGPVSLFSISVDPGNVTVAKGGDELIG